MTDTTAMSAKELLGFYQEELYEEARRAKKKENLFVGLHPLLLRSFVWLWM